MTCRRKTRRQAVDWVMYYAGAVLFMLIPRWSATSRRFFIWQTRRAEQSTVQIRWHTEREPTSSVRPVGSPRDSLAMRVEQLHFLWQGWRRYGTLKDFLGTRHSLLSQFILFILAEQRLYIVKDLCIYTHMWLHRDCIWITVATK